MRELTQEELKLVSGGYGSAGDGFSIANAFANGIGWGTAAFNAADIRYSCILRDAGYYITEGRTNGHMRADCYIGGHALSGVNWGDYDDGNSSADEMRANFLNDGGG